MLARKNIFVLFIAIAFLVSCMPQTGLKPVSDMSPKEKATFFMSVYNAQAEDYKKMVTTPNMTDDQKQVLREKKKLLTELYPMIGAYTTYVDAGAIPDAATEAAITGIINQLTATALSNL